MTDGPSESSIVERAKAIILKPKDEWPVIERETTPSGEIFTRYVVPLAAIGPVAGFIGGQVFGYGAFGFSFRPSLTWGLSQALLGYVLSLVGVFLLAFVANKLAPNFGGVSNSRSAFKLVAYSMTASWIAGIFALIPSLSILSIVGLYSIYLFYVGVGPLMKVPAEKAMTYTIVTVICMIVIYLIIGAITAGAGRAFGGPSLFNGQVSNADGETVNIPGMGALDTGKVEQAAKDIEAAGKAEAVAPESLQALLPASIGSYARTGVESSKAGPTSQAEGTYKAGDKSFTLKVADAAVVGALTGMAGAFGVESNKEDADGYERTTTTDGNLVQEKWNNSSERGTFMTMVGKRFMIEAEGEAGSIDELKAAVAAVDRGVLASLAGS
jgi:hypothetical protein